MVRWENDMEGGRGAEVGGGTEGRETWEGKGKKRRDVKVEDRWIKGVVLRCEGE